MFVGLRWIAAAILGLAVLLVSGRADAQSPRLLIISSPFSVVSPDTPVLIGETRTLKPGDAVYTLPIVRARTAHFEQSRIARVTNIEFPIEWGVAYYVARVIGGDRALFPPSATYFCALQQEIPVEYPADYTPLKGSKGKAPGWRPNCLMDIDNDGAFDRAFLPWRGEKKGVPVAIENLPYRIRGEERLEDSRLEIVYWKKFVGGVGFTMNLMVRGRWVAPNKVSIGEKYFGEDGGSDAKLERGVMPDPSTPQRVEFGSAAFEVTGPFGASRDDIRITYLSDLEYRGTLLFYRRPLTIIY